MIHVKRQHGRNFKTEEIVGTKNKNEPRTQGKFQFENHPFCIRYDHIRLFADVDYYVGYNFKVSLTCHKMRTQIHWSVFRQLNFKTFIYLSLTFCEMEKKLYFFNLRWSRACGLVDEFSGKVMEHKYSVRLESKWRTNDADEPRYEKNNTFGQHTIANWTESNQNTTRRERECSGEETEGKHHHDTYIQWEKQKGRKSHACAFARPIYCYTRLHDCT